MNLTSSDNYHELLEQISRTYTQGRIVAMQAVNAHLIETCWQVGRHIVEFLSFPRSAWERCRGRFASLLLTTVHILSGRRASEAAFPRRAWERSNAKTVKLQLCIMRQFLRNFFGEI